MRKSKTQRRRGAHGGRLVRWQRSKQDALFEYLVSAGTALHRRKSRQ